MDDKSVVSKITVSELLKLDKEKEFPLELEAVSGIEGLGREIASEEINRPGLPLAGFYDCFANDRMQIFGRGEIAYIEKLIGENKTDNIEKFFQYEIPVCIVTHNFNIPQFIRDLSNKHSIPILKTKLPSKRFISLIGAVLSEFFAPYVTVHGNYVSIYNMGVLITGKSGIGKSESVLGLIERGHKFICDDIVKIKKIRTAHGFELVGEAFFNYGPYLEIRGIGIINVSQYYGEGKILKSEKLELIVDLHEWDSAYNYDRLGLDEKTDPILEMQVPKKEIPVRPGRNIPLLIEVAAYREILRKLGHNPAQELDEKILEMMKKEKEVV